MLRVAMSYLHFHTLLFYFLYLLSLIFIFFIFWFFPVYVNFHGIVNQCALIRSRVYNTIIEEERNSRLIVSYATYIYVYSLLYTLPIGRYRYRGVEEKQKRIPKWFHYKKRKKLSHTCQLSMLRQ